MKGYVMTKDEIIEMARQAGMKAATAPSGTVGDYLWGTPHELAKFFRLSYARGMLKQEEQFMQLFLDPENQPTQFGTATQEYREKEVKEVQDLLTDLAHHVRTKHLYGMEVQKMLEKEAAIRARDEA